MFVLISCGKEETYVTHFIDKSSSSSPPVICKIFEGMTAFLNLNDVNPNYVIGFPNLDFKEIIDENQPFNLFLGTSAMNVTKNFSMSCELYYRVKNNGNHTFHLTSDDGSYMFLNDIPVITNNGGFHSMQLRSTTRSLVKGLYKIRIDYFQGSGSKGLSLMVQEPANPPVSL